MHDVIPGNPRPSLGRCLRPRVRRSDDAAAARAVRPAPAGCRRQSISLGAALGGTLIEPIRTRIQHVVDALLDGVEERGTLDVIADLSPLPVTVIAELLGMPLADRAMFKIWSDDVVATRSWK